MKLQFFLLISCLGLASLDLPAQNHNHPHTGREIEFPEVPGYAVLKCDFHQHTVFSDGNVWPTIRVEEAVRDHLDAMAVTDHIEYQPHSEDIPHPDRNRSFEIVQQFAESFDLIVVNGSEITRDMPPGHFNAIFLEDANALIQDDVLEVFREARRQGAFIFWNHPNWTSQRSDGIARLDSLHLQLLEEDLIDGIEVVNDLTYSVEALQIAFDHDLTIMGTSDIHGLVDWQYEVPQGGHRPVTLVFAAEKSETALQEALEAGQTVVWFRNTLIGKEEFMTPLLQACMDVTEAAYQEGAEVVSVKINNPSDADLQLENQSNYTFHANADLITLPAHETTELQVKTRDRVGSFELVFRVLNAVTAPEMNPVVRLEIDVE